MISAALQSELEVAALRATETLGEHDDSFPVLKQLS
jgi:hypothetical protein